MGRRSIPRQAGGLVRCWACSHSTAGSHPRPQLATRFWPDVLDESARTSLRGALAALRRSLGPDADSYLVATRERAGLRTTYRPTSPSSNACGQPIGSRRRWSSGAAICSPASTTTGSWSPATNGATEVGGVLGELATKARGRRGPASSARPRPRRMVALDPLAEEAQRALCPGSRQPAIARRRWSPTTDMPDRLRAGFGSHHRRSPERLLKSCAAHCRRRAGG